MSRRPGPACNMRGKRVTENSLVGKTLREQSEQSGSDGTPSSQVFISDLRCARSPPAAPYSPPPAPPCVIQSSSSSNSSSVAFPALEAPAGAAASFAPSPKTCDHQLIHTFTPNMPIERLIDSVWWPCVARSVNAKKGLVNIWHEETQTYESNVPMEEVRMRRCPQPVLATCARDVSTAPGRSESFLTETSSNFEIPTNIPLAHNDIYFDTTCSMTDASEVSVATGTKSGQVARLVTMSNNENLGAIHCDDVLPSVLSSTTKGQEHEGLRDDALKQLIDMGFSRPLALKALRKNDGNLQKATNFCLLNPNVKDQPPTQTHTAKNEAKNEGNRKAKEEWSGWSEQSTRIRFLTSMFHPGVNPETGRTSLAAMGLSKLGERKTHDDEIERLTVRRILEATVNFLSKSAYIPLQHSRISAHIFNDKAYGQIAKDLRGFEETASRWTFAYAK